MAYIESAFYGDEKSMRNATKVLADKVLGTTIDLDVDEKLIPPFVVANKTELTTEDDRKIRKQAQDTCGGVDQECIKNTEARLRQEALAAKENQANSSANIIKGRRLTVNIIDEEGKRRRLVVPDGQKFKLDNVSVTDPRKGGMQIPPMEYYQNQFKLLGALILSTLVYVFSIVATYTIFFREFRWLAVPIVAISIFIPYSGYVMIFLWYMFNSAFNTYIGNQ
jgi:hypothetical protein